MHVVHNLIDEPIVVVTSFPPETNAADVAASLASGPSSPVGKGNPFYVFADLPGEVTGADFAGASLCSNKADDNQTAIDDMLATPPTDKVTFA